MREKKFFSLPFAICYLLFAIPAFASTGQVDLTNSVPDLATAQLTGEAGQRVTAWVQNFYQFSLMAGVFLAVGVIVWAGLRYALSAGNSSTQGDARDQILQAVLGLILLFGAYLILYTINPNLTRLDLLPTLKTVSAPAGTAGRPTTGDNCASGQCQTLPNCTPSSATNCGGAQGMVNLLDCVNQKNVSYAVNEGYPPVGAHSSSNHNNGCAIDVHVSNCQEVTQFMDAARACGTSRVLNEYRGCGGYNYANTTGGNIHVEAQRGNGGC